MESTYWKELLPIDRYSVQANGVFEYFDQSIMTLLYLPLIGPSCYSLYMLLWVESEKLSQTEQTHHGLMASLQNSLHQIFQERKKLEGIGLLKTYMKKEDDMRFFVYELQRPLSPRQFFDDGVLNIFLYNRLGKEKYTQRKQFFIDKNICIDNYEEVTNSFNDSFISIHPSELQTQSDLNSEEAFVQQSSGQSINIKDESFDFELFFAGLSETMIPRKAINPDVKDAIKKLSYIYHIPPLEMQKVVMSSIGEHDEISIEVLRKEARDWYQLEHGYELPHLSERVQPVKYSTMINKEPKTKEEQLIQQLERVSPKQLLIELSEDGAEPTVKDLQIVEDIMFRQKILPGVVNVLLYFVLLRSNMKLTKGFIEKIAGHWARKGVKTVLDAMELAKSEYRDSKIWQEGTKGRKQTTRQPIRKELLPEWLSEEEESKAIPSDELEAEKRELNEMLKKYKK